jgi:hypothetical protein
VTGHLEPSNLPCGDGTLVLDGFHELVVPYVGLGQAFRELPDQLSAGRLGKPAHLR